MSEFQKYEFSSAVDIFGGTSTVSLALKALNKKVYYNDILESNRITAVALLTNAPCLTNEDELFNFLNSIEPQQGFISENYSGIYYTHEENMWLDGAIDRLKKIDNQIQKAEILYCLIQACLQKRPFNLFHRKNLYLRENNNRDTKFGNWATWEKPFPLLMLRALKEVQKTRWTSTHTPTILPCSDAQTIPNNYDFVYLDPPYTPLKKNDISYMERYHFLEGLCSPDSWHERVDNLRKNKPIATPLEMQKWSKRENFKENLFNLIHKHKNSIVCLSYICDAYPSTDDIASFFKSNFKHMISSELKLPHAMSKKPKKEIMFIGAPK